MIECINIFQRICEDKTMAILLRLLRNYTSLHFNIRGNFENDNLKLVEKVYSSALKEQNIN